MARSKRIFTRGIRDWGRAVALNTPKGAVTLKNDFVFAMTGYRPDIEFLDAHGIHSDARSGARYGPCRARKRPGGIYLAGVMVAGMHTNEIFIENGRFHGKNIAEAIAAAISVENFSPFLSGQRRSWLWSCLWRAGAALLDVPPSLSKFSM